MLAIAVLTAGLLRAVMEKWAPARRAAATTSWSTNAESARSTTRPSPCGPPAPAAFAAASASATSRGAPRAEFVEPFRSRVATITGAASGLLTVASSAFQALHPGVAVAGALLGVAVRGLNGVVDIDIGDPVRPGQQRAAPGSESASAPSRRAAAPVKASGGSSEASVCGAWATGGGRVRPAAVPAPGLRRRLGRSAAVRPAHPQPGAGHPGQPGLRRCLRVRSVPLPAHRDPGRGGAHGHPYGDIGSTRAEAVLWA